MTRARWIVAGALVLTCLGATPAPLTLDVQVARSSFDLLDPIAVTVSVWNRGKVPAALHFAHTDEYAIDVLDGSTIVSSTLASSVPMGVPHTRTFFPGITHLAVYELNVYYRDRTVPRPGTYRLRVRLLDDSGMRPVEQSLRLDPPLPISALAKAGTQVVTVEGTLAPDRSTLTDASGSVTLSHKLLGVPVGATLAVRGAMFRTPSRTQAFDPVSWGVYKATQ
jgi:hypothetical protein